MQWLTLYKKLFWKKKTCSQKSLKLKIFPTRTQSGERKNTKRSMILGSQVPQPTCYWNWTFMAVGDPGQDLGWVQRFIGQVADLIPLINSFFCCQMQENAQRTKALSQSRILQQFMFILQYICQHTEQNMNQNTKLENSVFLSVYYLF